MSPANATTAAKSSENVNNPVHLKSGRSQQNSGRGEVLLPSVVMSPIFPFFKI
jgi:hypothetical protein